MSESQQAEDQSPEHFCPSCAAKLPAHIFESETPQCPVCGTRIDISSNPTDSADVAEPIDTEAPKRQSTETILLERFKHDADHPQRGRINRVTGIVLVIAFAAVSFVIYEAMRLPDKFAHPKGVELTAQQEAILTHATDSLNAILAKDPTDAKAHLGLGDAYYDAQRWADAKPEFEYYLARYPKDPGARVDYSYVLSQLNPNNVEVALAQIDTALIYKPDFLQALYNGGVLAVQIQGSSHMEALARAKSYFMRAKAVADTSAPMMAEQIDTLLVEMDKIGLKAPTK